MDIMGMVVNMLSEKLGVDAQTVQGTVESLIGDGDGGIDLASLVSSFQGGGLGDIVGSWLGDGENQGIDAASVVSALGSEKVSAAASALGVDSDSFAGTLSDILPNVIDQASSGGNILESLGGISGLAGMAKKFF